MFWTSVTTYTKKKNVNINAGPQKPGFWVNTEFLKKSVHWFRTHEHDTVSLPTECRLKQWILCAKPMSPTQSVHNDTVSRNKKVACGVRTSRRGHRKWWERKLEVTFSDRWHTWAHWPLVSRGVKLNNIISYTCWRKVGLYWKLDSVAGLPKQPVTALCSGLTTTPPARQVPYRIDSNVLFVKNTWLCRFST